MSIRVVQWGLGAMGSGIARLICEKSGLELVGGIDKWDGIVGKDVGEVIGLDKKLGITVTNDPDTLLDPDKVDIVVIATCSWVPDQLPDLERIINAGINVVSTAEEMAAPAAQHPELAAKIDKLAKEKGVSVLGTGVNPGFILDLLPVLLTAGAHSVEHIEARRVNDLSPYGATVLKTQGVGLTVEEFKKGVEDGSVEGHIGFPESIYLIDKTLGLGIDRVEQTREPLTAEVDVPTKEGVVKAGDVIGCAQTARAFRGDTEVIYLYHPQQVMSDEHQVPTGDFIEIKGKPNVHMSQEPEYAGGVGTQGLIVNSIPLVVGARAGLLHMTQIPTPSAICDDYVYDRQAW